MSERVYYMDRGSDTLVTDHQVVIYGHHYPLERIRGAGVESRHLSEARRLEQALKVLSLTGVVACWAARLFMQPGPICDLVCVLSVALAASSLFNLLLISLAHKEAFAFVLQHANGRREELAWGSDLGDQASRAGGSSRWQLQELAQAVREAVEYQKQSAG